MLSNNKWAEAKKTTETQAQVTCGIFVIIMITIFLAAAIVWGISS